MPMFNQFHVQQRQQQPFKQQLPPQEHLQQQTLTSWRAHIINGLANRRKDLYFRGNFGGSIYGCRGQQVQSCSPGIRPWIQAYANSRPELFSGVNDADLGSSGSISGSSFGMGMMGGRRRETQSVGGWFALCPSGAGCWSTRLFDAISHLVVPIILSNGAEQPFAQYLNYSSFAIELDTEPLLACPEIEPANFTTNWGLLPGASEEDRKRFGFPLGANATQWPNGTRCAVPSQPPPNSALASVHALAQQVTVPPFSSISVVCLFLCFFSFFFSSFASQSLDLTKVHILNNTNPSKQPFGVFFLFDSVVIRDRYATRARQKKRNHLSFHKTKIAAAAAVAPLLMASVQLANRFLWYHFVD